MNQMEEFLGQSQVEHPEEHPDEQSKPNEAKKKKLDRGRDRLMNLQECRDQYDAVSYTHLTLPTILLV